MADGAGHAPPWVCSFLDVVTGSPLTMLRTYNALIGESEFYSSERSNFVDSHKTFKRAIRSFTWEVTEVFSELPVVAFSWRHFGLFHGKFTCTSFPYCYFSALD
jgi:hypothetical protein